MVKYFFEAEVQKDWNYDYDEDGNCVPYFSSITVSCEYTDSVTDETLSMLIEYVEKELLSLYDFIGVIKFLGTDLSIVSDLDFEI